MELKHNRYYINDVGEIVHVRKEINSKNFFIDNNNRYYLASGEAPDYLFCDHPNLKREINSKLEHLFYIKYI